MYMAYRRFIFTTLITILLVFSTSYDSNIHLKNINSTNEINENTLITKKNNFDIEKKIIFFDKLSFLNKIIITDDKKYNIKSNSYFDNLLDIGIHNQICKLSDDNNLACKHVNDYINDTKTISSSWITYLIKYILIGSIIGGYIYIILT